MRFVLITICILSLATLARAEEASLVRVEFSQCQQAIENGKRISQTSSSYENNSFWALGESIFSLKISQLSLFKVTFICEKIVF